MHTKVRPLLDMTAGDLMTRSVTQLPEQMPLRDAGRAILKNQIGGAPVVDGSGQCVGVISAIDFLRVAVSQSPVPGSLAAPLPVTCSFQTKGKTADGTEVTLCTLPPGVCPIQVQATGEEGKPVLVCSQPHCVLTDWQVVNMEKLPLDPVRQYMTADPVTVTPATLIRSLAKIMIDAHIHRVIVVDSERKPVGIVSSMDILAALARAETD